MVSETKSENWKYGRFATILWMFFGDSLKVLMKKKMWMKPTYTTSPGAHSNNRAPRVGVRVISLCGWQFSGVIPSTDCIYPVIVDSAAQMFSSCRHRRHQRPLVLSRIVPLHWTTHSKQHFSYHHNIFNRFVNKRTTISNYYHDELLITYISMIWINEVAQ